MRLFFFLFGLLAATPAAAQKAACTLITDFETQRIIHQSGDCETRRGAQSTFKIALAVMGFEEGILQDAHNPVWLYEPGFTLNRPEDKEPTDPTYWERESVVWFSQKLTRTMGMETLKDYVERFEYGNKDLSGNPGKNDGLTNAWLSSSLTISPFEQTVFLRKLLTGNLGVSPETYSKVRAIIPVYQSGGWTVHGKTGTGFHREKDGSQNHDLQEGWFTGWAKKEGQTILFATFIADDQKEEHYAGPRARDAFLKKLPQLLAEEEKKQ